MSTEYRPTRDRGSTEISTESRPGTFCRPRVGRQVPYVHMIPNFLAIFHDRFRDTSRASQNVVTYEMLEISTKQNEYEKYSNLNCNTMSFWFL